SRVPLPARLPQGLGRSLGGIDGAGGEEQQVGEPVEVLDAEHGNALDAAQGDERALRAAAYGAREVARGRGARAARQHELAQRRQRLAQDFDLALELLDVGVPERRAPRDADLAA